MTRVGDVNYLLHGEALGAWRGVPARKLIETIRNACLSQGGRLTSVTEVA